MIDKEYTLGWGTLALVNAGLAQAHRRSGLTWFIASLFLGPLATLLIVLWYRAPAQNTPPSTFEGSAATKVR